MKTKHSEGKWRNSLHVNKANEHTIYSEHGKTICIISKDITKDDSEENRANAQLIALAPLMLETLELVRYTLKIQKKTKWLAYLDTLHVIKLATQQQPANH